MEKNKAERTCSFLEFHVLNIKNFNANKITISRGNFRDPGKQIFYFP